MKYLAQAKNPSRDGWEVFIGRWQPWHKGHRWLIDQQINRGGKALIMIRDMEPNDSNPFTAEEVRANLGKHLSGPIEAGKVMIMVIPDIASINIGRGVGYDIIEHTPPDEVAEISGTATRAKMREDGTL